MQQAIYLCGLNKPFITLFLIGQSQGFLSYEQQINIVEFACNKSKFTNLYLIQFLYVNTHFRKTTLTNGLEIS